MQVQYDSPSLCQQISRSGSAALYIKVVNNLWAVDYLDSVQEI